MIENKDYNQPQNSLNPISISERIQVLDVLRGFTLIGILLMNIEWFNRPVMEITRFDLNLTSSDHAVSWFIKCFIEGKFYRLFSLLFGMGFAVMLIRARESGLPFTAMFFRRMLALLIIGTLHLTLLWKGDILHDYAVAGMLLLAWVMLLGREKFKKYDNPTAFLKIGLSLLMFPIIISMIAGIWFGMTYDTSKLRELWAEKQEVVLLSNKRLEEDKINSSTSLPDINLEKSKSVDKEDDENKDFELMNKEERIQYLAEKRFKSKKKRQDRVNNEVTAMTDKSYWINVKHRLKQLPKSIAKAPIFSLFILIPVFMLGYWLIYSGKFKDAQANIGFFKSLAWIGLTGGCVLSIGPLLINLHPASEYNSVIQQTTGTLFFFGQSVLAAGYLGLIVCMFYSNRWQPRLKILAPIGRMALTNYIMHSLILCAIFYGYAGGMFGQISRAPQMLIVLAIIIFQLIFCKWWLSKYRYGPLEWLWKCFTYNKFQPLKLKVNIDN